ncbi:MAG TPA: SDR family oxidoreductase, partial [Phenylobacterium sp.]|nr:SDR family oxidoreductase [Phenylobacterium sp.]
GNLEGWVEQGEARVRLEPVPEGTRLHYEVEAKVGGKLAQLGSRIIDGFARKMAEELKAEGITVNAVLPSIIDTPANRADMPDADPANWVAPADLAEAMLFLASDKARAITGALLPVTGRV